MMKFLLCHYFVLVLSIASGSASKSYDLDAESLRLYGEDFPSALQGFRRTTEYVNILSDRVAQMKEEIETMGNGLYYHEINSLNLELRYAVSGCEPNDTSCELNARRSPRVFDSLAGLGQDSSDEDPGKEDIVSGTLQTKRRMKKQAEDNAMKAINFISTAMRNKALEKFRAVFNPIDKTQPLSLSKTIEDYARMLRNKTDSATTKSDLKYLNDYPLRKYNKNKYVDIAFKHAKQLVGDIITNYKQSLKLTAARTYMT